MTRRVNLDQWTDHEHEPIIIWAYVGYYDLEPVAVNDTNENDIHQEYAAAWYAARSYMTLEEVTEEYRHEYTAEQIEEMYSRRDWRTESAGLPREYYVEGVNEDGSDAIIYIDEQTEFATRRESLKDAARYLDPEDVAEIYREIIAAREDYAR